MPIKTGDTFVPKNADRYVIDVSGAESNPIRGIYHANNPWTTIGGVDTYLEDGSVDHPHMRKDSFISIPLADGTGLKRTYYQSLINAPSSPDYSSGTALGGVTVENMSYNWQQRKHFHEFCMQYDKYGPIDATHYAQYPEEYDFLVWRKDKRQFQRTSFETLLGGLIDQGMNEVVNSGFLNTIDVDPSQSNSYSGNVTGDLNGDGVVSTADLLIFQTMFGNIVEDQQEEAGLYTESFLILAPPGSQDYLLEHQITDYVGGPDAGDGTMIDFQNGPQNPNGANLTIPNSCYITIPSEYTLLQDEPQAFLFGVSQVQLFSDPSDTTNLGYGHTDYIKLNSFTMVGEDANFNKAFLVEVLADIPEVPAGDKVYLTLRSTFRRKYGSSFTTRETTSTTKGEGSYGFGGNPYGTPRLYGSSGSVSPLSSSVGASFDVNPILSPGSHEDIKLRMWVAHPGGTGDDGVGPWDYRRYSSADDGFTNDIDHKRLLRVIGGDNETKDVKISVGFYTEHGHIDQINIKQIKISLKPLGEV